MESLKKIVHNMIMCFKDDYSGMPTEAHFRRFLFMHAARELQIELDAFVSTVGLEEKRIAWADQFRCNEKKPVVVLYVRSACELFICEDNFWCAGILNNINILYRS